MRSPFVRRARYDAALAEAAALRTALAVLGRRLDGAGRGPLGDTVPMPRYRSGPPPGRTHDRARPPVPWGPAGQ